MMEESSDNSIDDKSHGIPSAVNVSLIFSFIGNGLWGLLFLLILGITLSSPDELLNALKESDPAEFKSMGSEIFQLIYLFFGGGLLLCILSIVGAIMLFKANKKGMILFAIGNGLWGIVLIGSGTIFLVLSGLISVLLIFIIGRKLKELN